LGLKIYHLATLVVQCDQKCLGKRPNCTKKRHYFRKLFAQENFFNDFATIVPNNYGIFFPNGEMSPNLATLSIGFF
jgi:hypothetical protein